jgi:hypothetical protein
LSTGYDPYGYNYQARLFRGSYANVYLGRDGFPPYEDNDEAYLTANPDAENHWTWPYRKVTLIMKWNDAWLSNKDCSVDGSLDRHYGSDSYIGSGAWETNHQYGSYLNWDLTGTYTLLFTCTSGCSGDWPHTMVIDVMDMSAGTFDGNGYYINDPGYTWDISEGAISGTDVSFKITYTGSNSGYFVDLSGSIDSTGILSGTATSGTAQTFTWETVEGVAVGETCEWNYFVKIVAVPADATKTDGIWYNSEGVEIGPDIWGQFAIIQQVENDACAGISGKQYGSPAGPGFGKF